MRFKLIAMLACLLSVAGLTVAATRPAHAAASDTVTATANGSPAGVNLKVLVLTGATAAGGAQNATAQSTSAAPAWSLTPNGSHSLPVYVIYDQTAGTSGQYTAKPSNTLADNSIQHDAFADGYYNGTVTGGTAVTLGSSTPTTTKQMWASYEVPASGAASPALDASTPAVVKSGSVNTVTTASFTPPDGSVLVAVASGNNATSLTVTDQNGLAWTSRSAVTGGGGRAVVYTATVPGASQPPTVSTTDATGVSSAGARLNGSVNPNGQATTYQFDYGPTTSYGTSVPAPAGSAGSGTAAVNESFDLSGLNPSQTYHYRIEATNASGTATGTDKTFTTSAAVTAPGVNDATDVTSSSATVSGSVNPQGAATTYQFDYGTTTAYGSSVPSPAGSAGSGTAPVNETANLANLSPGTVYHFRIEATNSGGTTSGPDETFTTTGGGAGGTHFMDFGPSAACPDSSGNGCAGNPNTYPLTDASCVNAIVPDNTERIAANATSNAQDGPANPADVPWGPYTVPSGLAQWDRDALAVRGYFNQALTGSGVLPTTDNVLAWAACKWGWNEDWLRAEAVSESSWHQSEGGDVGCGIPHSFGILQIRDSHSTDCTEAHDARGGYDYTSDVHPHGSTALNAEAAAAYFRACLDGTIPPSYGGNGFEFYDNMTVAQDAAAHGGGPNPTGPGWQYVIEGCVGSWFNGRWPTNDTGEQNYVTGVKNHLANRDWNGLS